ncbi:MAG: hypothetical protein ACLR7D_16955 [Lachnospira eligens]
MVVQNMNNGILVVPDNTVKPAGTQYGSLVLTIGQILRKKRYSIETQLDNLMRKIYHFKQSFIGWNSRIDLAESSVGLGALVTAFLAFYFGSLFI